MYPVIPVLSSVKVSVFSVVQMGPYMENTYMKTLGAMVVSFFRKIANVALEKGRQLFTQMIMRRGNSGCFYNDSISKLMMECVSPDRCTSFLRVKCMQPRTRGVAFPPVVRIYVHTLVCRLVRLELL